MKVNYEITTHCNARCPTCDRTINPPKLTHMSLENFRPMGTIQKFCGERGDPLMHPEIEKFFDQCSTIEVHTNGGMRETDWYAEMMQKYNIQFHFGIDGIGRDKYRIGVNNKKAIQNMVHCSKYGFTVWEFTLFKWNYKLIPEVMWKAFENRNLKVNFRQNSHFTEDLPYGIIKNLIYENRIEKDYPWKYYHKSPKIKFDVR